MIDKIIGLEWDFLQEIQHTEGRADCQDDFNTFSIMRSSQFKAWDQAVVESYRNDLLQYKENGRNPIYEKYGLMMEHSDPEYYASIKHRLPALSAEQKQLINRIVQKQLHWKVDFGKLYPNLNAQGRRLYSFEDTKAETSFETYLRGELATYSVNTLRLYEKQHASMAEKGQNLVEETMKHTVSAYGYRSLEAANERAI